MPTRSAPVALRHRPLLALPLLALATAAAGCTDRGAEPPEVLSSDEALVDERAIRAALRDGGLDLRVPLTRRGTGALTGEIVVNLLDVSAGEPEALGEVTLPFRQEARDEVHALRVDDFELVGERAEAAPIIVRWRVRLPGTDLHGRRSLYAALGALDVQLRVPTELAEGATSPARVIVRDAVDGAPVPRAEVHAVLLVEEAEEASRELELFSGETDDAGVLTAAVAMPEGVEAGTVRVTVADADAQVWATQAVRLREDNLLYLSSDKTIYKPGQEVNLRLLALTGVDRLPMGDAEVTFVAKDGRGNKVFKRRGRTDAFGVAAVAVPLDTQLNEGDWEFSAEVDARRTVLTLPVETYVLPKLRVQVSSEREFVLPGETLRGRVSAVYVFGEPVTSADVTVTARTDAGGALGAAAGRTDAQGQLAFEIPIPLSAASPSLEDAPQAIVLDAQVTDAAGQTEHGGSTGLLAAAPLRIRLLAERQSFVAGEPATHYFSVTDAVGRPVRASLSVTGALDEPALETDADGLAPLRLTTSASAVTFRATAEDGAGRVHEREFTLGAGRSGPGFEVRAEPAVVRPGEMARILVRADASVERAFVDVYRGAAGRLSAAVELVDGEGQVDLPIAADDAGLLVVSGLGVQGDREALRAQAPILVVTDEQLRVSVSSAAESYLPGAEAALDVRVTDAHGAPRVAAIGLTVVDDAVFALGGEPARGVRSLLGLDETIVPPELQIAGRSAAEILELDDAERRELLARLMFASLTGVPTPSADINTRVLEAPRVRSALATKVQHDLTKRAAELARLRDDADLDAEALRTAARSLRQIDPFGSPYHAAIEPGDWGDEQLVLTSDGPDELAGTADDVEARTSLGEILYAGMWGAEGDRAFAGGPPMADMGGAPAPTSGPDDGPAARTRSDFRETVYVNPLLVTDSAGRAQVRFPLADSITTWRATAEGSTATGELGATQARFRTFQTFFVDLSLPPSLTNGDVVDVPAVVYNYQDEPSDVTVSLRSADWFELLSPPGQTVHLAARAVAAVKFQLAVTRAGDHELALDGSAGSVADSLARIVHVAPEGQPDDETVSGRLSGTVTHAVVVPEDTTEGGLFVELALTAGFAAEAVQGLEGMMQEPSGCFEQTTANAWPNTLVANYLEATGQLTEENRATIVDMVTRGYQRLLTFESPTGGFNWWGDSDPGNRILSAIMLWHLKDLESLIEIDTEVRDRTLAWLVGQQRGDGSFEAGDALHAGNEVLGTSEARTTAFIAWALAHTGWAEDTVDRATGYLRGNLPPTEDLYANALTANALGLVDPAGAVTATMFGRLDAAKDDRGEDGIVWPSQTPSWTGADGDAAALETTGLVAYGLLRAEALPDAAAGAVRFIVANKDSVGTWYNTQATMNALRALSAAASPTGSDAVGTLRVRVDGVLAREIPVDLETGELLRRFDLTPFVTSGDANVSLEFVGTGEVSYRLTRRAFRPALPAAQGPLALEVQYDRTTAAVGSPIQATVLATNGDDGIRDQVIVRLGRAPGFEPWVEDLDALVSSGAVALYEVQENDVTLYLMGMAAGETRTMPIRFTPNLAVDALAPASRIYSYYEPDLAQSVAAQHFIALPAE